MVDGMDWPSSVAFHGTERKNKQTPFEGGAETLIPDGQTLPIFPDGGGNLFTSITLQHGGTGHLEDVFVALLLRQL